MSLQQLPSSQSSLRPQAPSTTSQRAEATDPKRLAPPSLGAETSSPSLGELVEVSAQAKQQLASNTPEVRKLARQATAMSDPYNAEKVAHFKTLVNQPGALKQYLDSLDTTFIAEQISESVAKNFLLE